MTSWVLLCRNPDVYVNLDDGQTAEMGCVVGGKPEYLALGRVSEALLLDLKRGRERMKVATFDLNGQTLWVHPCPGCSSINLSFDAGMMGGVIKCKDCGYRIVQSDIFEAMNLWNERSKPLDDEHLEFYDPPVWVIAVCALAALASIFIGGMVVGAWIW